MSYRLFPRLQPSLAEELCPPGTPESTYVSAVNRMLTRPANAFEIAEAEARVNVDPGRYYQVPVNQASTYALLPGIKDRMNALMAASQEPEQRAVLYSATCVAILRGDGVERLRPPSASAAPRRSSVQSMPASPL